MAPFIAVNRDNNIPSIIYINMYVGISLYWRGEDGTACNILIRPAVNETGKVREQTAERALLCNIKVTIET